MKKVTSFTVIAIMAIFLINDGCKKDEKLLNILTIAGNTDTAVNNDYIPETGYYYQSYQADCNIPLYRTDIWIHFTNGESCWIRFYQPTEATTVPLGTFNLATDCMEGFVFSFYLSDKRKSAGLCLTSGTIIVTQSGDIYDVDINLTIDPDCGGGTIKGNFNGPLELGIN